MLTVTGLGMCDQCPVDANNDEDMDGICGDIDTVSVANALIDPADPQADNDGDGIGDACDARPEAATNDTDGDGVCDNRDTV